MENNRCFDIGSVYIKSKVANKMVENDKFADFIIKALNYYVRKDWGDSCTADMKKVNEIALKKGFKLCAAYNYVDYSTHMEYTIWIITESDRKLTTILFPEEY